LLLAAVQVPGAKEHVEAYSVLRGILDDVRNGVLPGVGRFFLNRSNVIRGIEELYSDPA